MGFRRGFKAEANGYAREFREELGLAVHMPMSPWALAEHLAIPVFALSDFSVQIPEAVSVLSGKEKGAFSAATVFHGTRRMIVHNDSHPIARQAANIAHELSHGILGHPPAPPLDDYGCRNFNRALEDEANWLGPALLVSEEAALHVARQGVSIKSAASCYGVSEDLMRMRLNVTGAMRRAYAGHRRAG